MITSMHHDYAICHNTYSRPQNLAQVA